MEDIVLMCVYLNCVHGQIAGHAAGVVLDGDGLRTPLEGAGLLWGVFPVVVWKTSFSKSL